MNIKKRPLIIILLLILTNLFSVQDSYAKKKKQIETEPMDIEFVSSDGFNIYGEIDIPARANLKHKVPLVIFLHSLGNNHKEWLDFPQKIKSLGYAALSLDVRGHGQSLVNGHNKIVHWQNFKDEQYKMISDDIKASLSYLEEEYLEIDTSKTIVVSTGLAVNSSIIAASEESDKIKALVCLSPVINFKGLNPKIELIDYGNHPILYFVSKGDKLSYNSTMQLVKYSQGKTNVHVYKKAGSGVNILKLKPESQDIIFNWLISNTFTLPKKELVESKSSKKMKSKKKKSKKAPTPHH